MGISQKAVLHNTLKSTPPSYTSEKTVHVLEGVVRKKDQPRNQRCLCGSGRKYKLCCGK